MNNKIVLVLSVSIILNITLIYAVFNQKKALLLAKNTNTVATITPTITPDNLFEETNPNQGYEINAIFGSLGPKMIDVGVIDADKFKQIYVEKNQPLTPEQEEILFNGSGKKIRITLDNANFLLNFFWALGLANKTKILTDGDMVKYGGKNDLGNFASTGGWSLGKSDAMQYYAKTDLVPLSTAQEKLVENVASNIFRPCCNNSTAFPDCNHGMALLGLLEVMAAGNLSEDEMYDAAKYFNAFWFPGNYYDLALYFKNKENKSFKDLDPRILLSKEYSSASGWKSAKSWLSGQGIIKEPPKSGSGCGV